MRKWIILLVWCVSVPVLAGPALPFDIWLEGLKQEARMQGISEAVLADAFATLKAPEPEVVARDRTQPEKTILFSDYLKNPLSVRKISRARERLEEHRDLLDKVEQTYGVPKAVMLALWGVESDFGDAQGNHMITESLATLAYDGRRSTFFRKQLLAALKIMQDQNIDATSLVGSWAGAMGQVQFMPTSFLAYAVDFDGDGLKDIWNSTPDALASMANYLSSKGWDAGLGWGKQVMLPDTNVQRWKDMKGTRTLKEWKRTGMRYTDGLDLADIDVPARLVIPDDNVVRAYLVFSNYDVLMDWNRSVYFATAIGLLSDIIGKQ